MPRSRRTIAKLPIEGWKQKFLLAGTIATNVWIDPAEYLDWMCDDAPAARAAWETYGQELLKDFIAARPGHRPWCWWRFANSAPRMRLGGSGVPVNEVLSGWKQDYRFGIPQYWVVADYLELFPKLLTRSMLIDHHNPPMYESQAEFLRRHELLSKKEWRVLDSEKDFEPEKIYTDAH